MNEAYLNQVHEFLNHEIWNKKHIRGDVKQRGEVFTPTKLVNEMLNALEKQDPTDFTDPTKTFLDSSCGNGQFLAAVLERKMRNGISHKQALMTIYGVELDSNNCEMTKLRLSLKSADPDIMVILNRHVVCADALDPKHQGWSEVGFYWSKDDPA